MSSSPQWSVSHEFWVKLTILIFARAERKHNYYYSVIQTESKKSLEG